MIWGKTKTHRILGNPQKNGSLTHHGSFPPSKSDIPSSGAPSMAPERPRKTHGSVPRRSTSSWAEMEARKPQQFCRGFLGQIVPKNPKRYSFFRKGNGTPDFREFLTCRLVKYYNLARSLHRKYLEISVAMAFLSRFNKSEKWAQRKVTSIHTIHTGLGVRALVFSKVGFCR